jgi:transcriptional regulator with XRE-family HTH domain
MSISENIKKYREAKGITQVQLAEKIKVHQSLVAQFERGSKVPSMPMGEELTKVLDCTLYDLLGHSPPQSQGKAVGG